MNRAGVTLLGAGLSLFVVSTASAQDALSVDFQSDMVGMAPQSASYVSAPRTTRAEVVDAQSDPVDPFGGDKANKSLLLEDQDLEHNASVAFSASGAGLTNGRMTVKLIVSDMNTAPENLYADVRLGEGPTNAATIGPWIDIHGQVMRVQSPNGEQPLDNMISADMPHVLTIEFDTAKGTFTGMLDEKPLTSAGKPGPFAFYKPIKNVNAVQVDCAFSTRTDSRLFIDDLKLGPAAASPQAKQK